MIHGMKAREILTLLRAAAASGNANTVEEALAEAYGSGLNWVHVPVLIELLSLPWHQRHEDIVLTLQELRDPRAIDALFATALIEHDYLAFDDLFGLARKCTWALADIGSELALERLRTLAALSNPIIAGYARKRIDNWDDEKTRKAV